MIILILYLLVSINFKSLANLKRDSKSTAERIYSTFLKSKEMKNSFSLDSLGARTINLPNIQSQINPKVEVTRFNYF